MDAPRRPFAVYAITKHGLQIAARLCASVPGADLWVSEKLFADAPEGARRMPLPMGPTLTAEFTNYDCHVFIISVGAVVRMIAPLLKNKKVDPAVICVDDDARFSICVLSGHVGRGNTFTTRVAEALGSTAVITTASDVRGTLTVDILGRELGWRLDDMDRNVTRGCAAVVNATRVLVVQETGEPAFWPVDKGLPEGVEYATSLEGVDPSAFEILLIVSDRDVRASHPAHWENSVIYRPRSLVLGVGCDRGTPVDLVRRGVETMMKRHGLSPLAVRALATIDVKRDEVALQTICQENGWPMMIFTAAELDEVPGIETPSDVVKKHVGTRGVAEPAALLGAGAKQLLVNKEIYTEEGAGRSMTFAVARTPFDARPSLPVKGTSEKGTAQARSGGEVSHV